MPGHDIPGLSRTVQSPKSKLPWAGTGARNSTRLQRRDNVTNCFDMTETAETGKYCMQAADSMHYYITVNHQRMEYLCCLPLESKSAAVSLASYPDCVGGEKRPGIDGLRMRDNSQGIRLRLETVGKINTYNISVPLKGAAVCRLNTFNSMKSKG